MQDAPDNGYYSPSQAGEILNLSKRRVLQMLERRELEGEKDPATGRWKIPTPALVLLKERRELLERQRRAASPPEQDTPERELVDTLKDQVEDLRQRLDRETEANRENRRIIAGLMNRIPELEAPESSETGEAAAQAPTGPGPTQTPQSDSDGPQERTSRPWWRRIIRS